MVATASSCGWASAVVVVSDTDCFSIGLKGCSDRRASAHEPYKGTTQRDIGSIDATGEQQKLMGIDIGLLEAVRTGADRGDPVDHQPDTLCEHP